MLFRAQHAQSVRPTADGHRVVGSLKRRWFAAVMRRKLPDGSYEYREMTAAEVEDYDIETADRFQA